MRERTISRLLYGVTALTLVFLWLPLTVMIFLSIAENASTVFPFRGFTLTHMVSALNDGLIVRSVLNSAFVATVAASIATVVGVLASFALARYEFPWKDTYRTLLITPMIIPGIVLGLGLLVFFNTILGMELSLFTIILTHSLYGLPFVVLIVSSRLYAFDSSVEEAARDLGADQWETFWDVTFPIVRPAVMAGAVFAWIRSFEDFIRAFMVQGTENVMTVTMFGLIKYNSTAKMNAISTLIIFLIAILLAVGMNLGNVTEYVVDAEGE
ncbi:MAG: ABC-type spermidine/putrescine transport system permease subunit II [Haloarculaceae archaeon]|jgi:ABC-type spermidine/putrescine transport system permease subunit II